MIKDKPCDLSSCFLCTNCNLEWRELIALKKKTILFKKGRLIFTEADKVEGIYFMYSGSAKVHMEWSDRKELIIRFTKAGDVLGHRGFGGTKTYPVSATALEDSMLCFIENDFFEKTLMANPSLTYKIMQLYSDELQKAELRMRNLALMEVRGRVAETLLEIATVFGTGKNRYINMPVSRQDISSYAGTTYETVFRLLRSMVQEKLISVSGKSIRINEPEKLKRIVRNAK